MIRMQSWENAKAGKKALQKDTFEGFVTDFIVPDENEPTRAQAFLVEQKPNWVLPPHFHLEHQFQVVTAGAGTIGRSGVTPLFIHYASPETGYGPVTAGPQGVSYLTLRAVGDTGAWYLHKPEQRERMRRGLKKQQEHGAPKTRISAAGLRSLGAPSLEELISPRENGLAGHLLRLPPEQMLTLPSQHANAGRFYVATCGSMRVADAELHAISTVFASFDETFTVKSGPNGLEVLVLQFPVDAIEQEKPE